MTAPIRYTRQIAANLWITRCKVCPQSSGKAARATESLADEWWALHVESAYHLARASSDGSPSPEEELLRKIFGITPKSPSVAPNERTGHLKVRPKHVRMLDNDNPRRHAE